MEYSDEDVCPFCDGPTEWRKCKEICPNCGVLRTCADLARVSDDRQLSRTEFAGGSNF